MHDHFPVTIQYKGKEMQFDVLPVIYGFTYKFQVTVNDTDIIFERDEEGSYRAMKAPGSMDTAKEPDVAILVEIQKQLELIFD